MVQIERSQTRWKWVLLLLAFASGCALGAGCTVPPAQMGTFQPTAEGSSPVLSEEMPGRNVAFSLAGAGTPTQPSARIPPEATSSPMMEEAVPEVPIFEPAEGLYDRVVLEVLTVPGARVFLDGEEIGLSPIRTIVAKGRHYIEAFAPGREPRSRWVFVGQWPLERVLINLPRLLRSPWEIDVSPAADVYPSPDNRWLAVVDHGLWILEVGESGTEQRTLIDPEIDDPGMVKWLWDGEGLLVVQFRSSPEASSARTASILLYLQAEGWQRGRLVEGDVKGEGFWLSPDQRHIAIAWPEPDVAIGLLGLDGRWQALLKKDEFPGVPGENFTAAWSPDGRRLAFCIRGEGEQGGRAIRDWDLWLLDLETGEKRQVLTWWDVFPPPLSWSPDGERIALVGGRVAIYTLQEQRVVQGERSGEFAGAIWSPDGQYIAVHDVGYATRHPNLWLVSVTSGRMRSLLDDQVAFPVRWTGDGRAVVIVRATENHRIIETVTTNP